MKNKKYFNCATIGGTFNSFHKGHKEYIDIAFSIANIVFIHIISDDMAKRKKNYSVTPFDQRLKKILEYLSEKDWIDRSRIYKISSTRFLEHNILKYNFDIAVVEPAYFGLFNTLNKKRGELGKKKFCIIHKPRTIDINGNDISSTIIESERLLRIATER